MNSTEASTPTAMERPPTLGIGAQCTLRSQGTSTQCSRTAYRRSIGISAMVINMEINKVERKIKGRTV